MKICNSCKISYADEKKFCQKCGLPLAPQEKKIESKEDAKKLVFEERLKSDPLNHGILREYAEYLYSITSFKDFFPIALKTIAIDENDFSLKEKLFHAYINTGNYDYAVEIGEEIFKLKSSDTLFIEKLSKALHITSHSAKADKLFEKILAIDPDNKFALLNIAGKLLSNNDLENALPVYKKLFQQEKNDRLISIYAGIDQSLNKEYDAAAKILENQVFVNNQLRSDFETKNINDNRALLYFIYSTLKSKGIQSSVSDLFSKINLKCFQEKQNQYDKNTLLEIVSYVTEKQLEKFKDITDRNQIKELGVSYLDKLAPILSKEDKGFLAPLWLKIANKQIELEFFKDALFSLQKAFELEPNSSHIADKINHISDTLKSKQKKKGKNQILFFGGTIIFLLLCIALFSAKKRYEDQKAWERALELNTLDAYQNYFSYYQQGRHLHKASAKIDSLKQINNSEKAQKPPTTAAREVQGQLPLFPSMLLVKGGTFLMGCSNQSFDECWDDEKPSHSVTLSDFNISKTEVTVEQFKEFINETSYLTDAERLGGSHIYEGSDWVIKPRLNWRFNEKGNLRAESELNYPVIYISWNDATAYCNWLSRKTGEKYRLPREAEWEYAAKGGTHFNASDQKKYAGSNNIGEVAWFADNSGNQIHLVGRKRANALGLFDMSGNVWEWCHDYYGNYTSASKTNPTGPISGESRVLKGGAWMNVSRSARVSHRGHRHPNFHSYIIGFRVVKATN